MTNNELTPAEALRALADGETLTDVDGATCKLENDLIAARNKGGEMLGEFWLSMANWSLIPKRDVGVDPKAGDVICDGGLGATVLYVDAKYVACERFDGVGTYPWVCSRGVWAEWCKDAQSVRRVEEKANG